MPRKGGWVMRLCIDPVQLRRTRLTSAMTQRELARAADLDQSVISYLETGGRGARVTTIRRLAAALGCEPLDIAFVDTASSGDATATETTVHVLDRQMSPATAGAASMDA